ncbi:hypothetical protein DBR43_00630 [Pedobacter sp. KBW06]|nr:hypothetical protein DBR43_00630 [Pedobacter sp. KBW06]
MSESLKEIRNTCIGIIDNILSEVIETENEAFWRTSVKRDRKLYAAESEPIYSGTGGIILLLIEAYKTLKNERYLELIVKGCEWLIGYVRAHPTNYYAFFTGRIGVSYILLQAYDLTGNERYLTESFLMVEDYSLDNEGRTDSPVDDLLNGRAGILLGFLHLYEYRQDPKILEKIELLSRYIIDAAELSDKGVFWDRSEHTIQALCGFSHGSGGIGWVLMETGSLFNNDSLIRFAKQAIYYENQNFSTKNGNWPDFRRGMYEPETCDQLQHAFKSGDFDPFFRPRFMSAWCHGAPGIGLSRIRMAELIPDDFLQRDIKRALKATTGTLSGFDQFKTFTLCHGLGGNAMLYLEAFKFTGKKQYFEVAVSVAEAIVSDYENGICFNNGHSVMAEDSSLFMGNAGIAFFLLSVLYPFEVNNYLIPKPSYKKKMISTIAIDDQLILNALLRSSFPLLQTNHDYDQSVLNGIDIGSLGLLDQLKSCMKDYSRKNIDTKRIYRFEAGRLSLRKKLKSYAYEFVYQGDQVQQNSLLLKLGFEDLLGESFIVNDSVVFSKLKLDSGEFNYLVFEMSKSSRYHLLNDFSLTLLKAFRKGLTVAEVIRKMRGLIEGTDVDQLIFGQVCELIKSTFLIPYSKSKIQIPVDTYG